MEDLEFVNNVNRLNRWKSNYVLYKDRIACRNWRTVESLLVENRLHFTTEELLKITSEVISHVEKSEPPLLEIIMTISWLQTANESNISYDRQEQVWCREVFRRMTVICRKLSPAQLNLELILSAYPSLFYQAVVPLFSDQ